MDIQKERKLFENWWVEFNSGRQISCDYVSEDNSYSVGYERVLCENSTFVATIGCWEYESDIIKVVSAFGKSFHSLMGRKEQN